MSASELEQAFEKRRVVNKRKPVFIKKDAHKKSKIKNRWRRPKGLHNKQRIKGKSHFKNPATGYGSPKQVKWLHSSGLFPVVVSNLGQLDSIIKEKHGILLSSRIGDQKRKALLIEIKNRGFVLINHDADKSIEKIDAKLKQRKEKRRKKLEKAKTKEKAKEKAKEKEKKKGIDEKVKKEELAVGEGKKPEEKKEAKKPEEMSEEGKKKLEKKEKDKLLIKKS